MRTPMRETPSGEESGAAVLTAARPTRRNLVVTAGSLLLISIALYSTPDYLEHWHFILQRLFYFPILVAGIAFGWVGGGLVAVISSVIYLLRHDNLDRLDTIDHSLDAAMFCLIGVLTGVLSGRERLQRENLARAATRLQVVYRELQDNVEHLKRAARMSALGQLSASLAHEIRNPLASIEGAAYVAQTEDNSGAGKEFLAIILKETRRLSDLVTNFLEFARPRAPQRSSVDVRLLAESVLTLVGQVAAEHHVLLQNQIEPATLPVDIDSEQMKQVLLNLFLNAIQAMPGGGTLTVSAASHDNNLVLRILDTGPGIAPEHRDEIFDPFFSTKQSGTGLGLPIAYQIVQQHGGELTLQLTSGAGSCFALRLPVAAIATTRQAG